MIEFRNVSKDYPSGTHALNGISLKIDKGEFVFIVGSSGAGKSTLLKLIMAEERLSKGEILVDGTRMSRLKRRKVPFLRRKMGIVFQDFRLIEKKTVYDNVAFAMRCVGASNKTIKSRVPYILKLVGLGKKMHNKPNQLSGGEQQRVALARALVNNPEIIIADEPTGNVDPEMSHEIIDLLSEINKQGTTIIIVTHEHDLVKEFGKRVIEIHAGKIVHDTMAEQKSVDEIELISSYDQEIPDDELSPLLKVNEETPEETQEIFSDSTDDFMAYGNDADSETAKTPEEKAVENINEIVESIKTDDREELLKTVTLDSRKIRKIMEADKRIKDKEAEVDSVIDSLR